LRSCREEGLAVRLIHQGRTWLATRDGIRPDGFRHALRQVARALPTAPYPEPRLDLPPFSRPPEAQELAEFPPAVLRALRSRHVAFPARIAVYRHRRWIQVIGPQWVPPPEQESFYSCTVETAWGRFGSLLPALDETASQVVADQLVASFRSRQATSPEAGVGPVVLGPAAAAVLLHEAIAHALEADTLAASGNPAAAIGVRLAASGLHVLDDPTTAPEGVRRGTDDEGVAVFRRWLLRDGVVEQPLADRWWANHCPDLLPGGGRRSSRHQLPGPRSTNLEVLAGEFSNDDLLGDDSGFLIPLAERGRLDPLSGRFTLEIPFARRIRSGAVAEPVGPCRLEGSVGELLAAIKGIGREPRRAGAGWCAKGGQRLPVWAKTPALRLEGVRVTP
jgi:predicted Zn-dependent protease